MGSMTAQLDDRDLGQTDEVPTTFQTPESGGAFAGIGLALAVLRKTGYGTFAELVAGGDEQKDAKIGALHFSAEQIALLEQNLHLLYMIRPGVTPAPCTECGVPFLAGKGSVGKICTVTRGCTGAPVKPSAATLTK